MSDSSHVVVATCRDSAEAALIRAVLTAHDIPLHISGENHAALVGLGAGAITQLVRVPREHADEAAALIQEMREGGEAQLADDEIPAEDTAERQEELTPDGALVTSIDGPLAGGDTISRLGKRSRITLAFLAGMVLQHGTAHMSVRTWKRGCLLAAVQVAGWWTLGARDVRLGGTIVVATIAMDLVGAVLHILQTPPPLPTAVVRRG